ncbi:hypothetical protein PAXINDRAFT_157955 [Paxillus involutus ATCC 200175]|uniref:Unplaced genomic scaffold PAXINscaffold_177, whole genome shotgun sequence n=1 Tax=Paxillus involutus ATCC 200175 TaxID=664439 RepID=A0A0C9TDX2_PAXIN|nr:hypothetical protein PAXINDRAFT_157955 [Paxillus involutus ATCC 200175]
MQRPLEKKLGTTTNGESPGHCPSIWLPNPGRAICRHEVLHSDSARKRKRARNGKPTAEQMMVLFDRAYEAATTFVAALDEVREAINREFLAIQQGVLRNDPDSVYQSEDADGDIGDGDGGRSFFDDGSLTEYDTNEDPGADDRDREQDTSPLEVPKRKRYASVSA